MKKYDEHHHYKRQDKLKNNSSELKGDIIININYVQKFNYMLNELHDFYSIWLNIDLNPIIFILIQLSLNNQFWYN